MGLGAQILTGKVMHRRLFPRENAFTYGIYYLALNLAHLPRGFGAFFGINSPGIISFRNHDHGPRDGSDLYAWVKNILINAGITDAPNVTLVCMPRTFGYVFNPVSFWLCRDDAHNLRAVLCEVNNTFGETHSYLCLPGAGQAITGDIWLSAQKIFHVSPFLEREGNYRFRFQASEEKFAVWIDYFAADGRKQLVTALSGKLVPLTRAALMAAFFRHPLVSLVAVMRIHMQALKLVLKRIRYIPKPVQSTHRHSRTDITQV